MPVSTGVPDGSGIAKAAARGRHDQTKVRGAGLRLHPSYVVRTAFGSWGLLGSRHDTPVACWLGDKENK
jgi:hypothetical protein